MKKVTLYVNSSCFCNPGPGGYGIVLICNNHKKEFSGGLKDTTSNRVELIAIIEGLKKLKEKCEVHVYTKLFNYIINGINKSWNTKKNNDLFAELKQLYKNHDITFHCKYHNDLKDIDYERAYKLAIIANRKIFRYFT